MTLSIDLEYHKGILFVRVSGNLNRRTSYKLNNILVPTIMKHGIKYLVYNLYNLQSLDEVGIKSLGYGYKATLANQGVALLCEVPGNLKASLDTLEIKKTPNELSAIKQLAV